VGEGERERQRERERQTEKLTYNPQMSSTTVHFIMKLNKM
jgi:hypothetical protein